MTIHSQKPNFITENETSGFRQCIEMMFDILVTFFYSFCVFFFFFLAKLAHRSFQAFFFFYFSFLVKAFNVQNVHIAMQPTIGVEQGLYQDLTNTGSYCELIQSYLRLRIFKNIKRYRVKLFIVRNIENWHENH